MLTDADAVAVRTYRDALDALFALALDGADATPRACEKALRQETVAGLGLRTEDRATLLAEAAADYRTSNHLCPYCGGAPHESEP